MWKCQYRNPCILLLFLGQEIRWDHPKIENKKEAKKSEDFTMGHSSIYKLRRWGGIDKIWLKKEEKAEASKVGDKSKESISWNPSEESFSRSRGWLPVLNVPEWPRWG